MLFLHRLDEQANRIDHDTCVGSFDGDDNVVIYIKENKQIRTLPANRCVKADDGLKNRLGVIFGAENVKFRL